MGHSEGLQKGLFCSLRDENCGDTNYKNNCEPKIKYWSDEYSFTQASSLMKYNAHHLLPVASVTEHICGFQGIQKVVRQTDWCVNEKPNIYGMPLWGHTIKYYCTIEHPRFFEDEFTWYRKRTNPPPFKDIPMHDCDHDLYQEEVNSRLQIIANNIKDVKRKHKTKIKELKSKLKKESRSFRTKLQDRAKRSAGGTHQAWELGKSKHKSNCYESFSMAGKPRKRIFTDFRSDKVIAKANSYLGL